MEVLASSSFGTLLVVISGIGIALSCGMTLLQLAEDVSTGKKRIVTRRATPAVQHRQAGIESREAVTEVTLRKAA